MRIHDRAAGILVCLDGFMNVALEQTEEWVDGALRSKFGDAFLRGNNGACAVVRFVCIWRGGISCRAKHHSARHADLLCFPGHCFPPIKSSSLRASFLPSQAVLYITSQGKRR
jgi:hypothetical protein